MLSLVVPETSETITLFSPKRAFTIEDLPAFGRPTIAIFIVGEDLYVLFKPKVTLYS